MTFSDPARETEIDVHLTAVDEPIVRANGKHFEQVMRTRGQLVLRGERYEVDSFHVRDRSWGELRPEDHNPAPPYNWVTGVLDNGAWAFNVGSLDDPAQKAHWLEQYPVPADKAFKDGWVRRDGRTIRLVHASRRVEREPGTLRPTHIGIEMHDAEGGVHEVTGQIVAGLPWGGWHNMNCHLGLVRWELDGHVGWGDSMDVQWNDGVDDDAVVGTVVLPRRRADLPRAKRCRGVGPSRREFRRRWSDQPRRRASSAPCWASHCSSRSSARQARPMPHCMRSAMPRSSAASPASRALCSRSAMCVRDNSGTRTGHALAVDP